MTKLETKILVDKLTNSAKNTISSIVKKNNKPPTITIISIGNDPASKWYNKSIAKISNKIGVKCSLIEYDDIKVNDAIKLVQKLSNDNNIHGILINQPLPQTKLNQIIEYIKPEKDIEGVSSINLGRLLLNKKTHAPCTPLAVMKLIEHFNIKLTGKKVTVIGRSNIVGKPLAILLTKANATVTLCHSKTTNIKKETKNADILIVAIGKAKLITKEWIKKDAIVIDVGTNYTKNGLCGDVNFESTSEKASMISPVPFGVGSLTNLMLIANVIDAYKKITQIE